MDKMFNLNDLMMDLTSYIDPKSISDIDPQVVKVVVEKVRTAQDLAHDIAAWEAKTRKEIEEAERTESDPLYGVFA